MAEKRNTHEVTAGRPKGQRPLGITMHTWKNNIEIDPEYNARVQILD
jgi:hypothetical protein